MKYSLFSKKKHPKSKTNKNHSIFVFSFHHLNGGFPFFFLQRTALSSALFFSGPGAGLRGGRLRPGGAQRDLDASVYGEILAIFDQVMDSILTFVANFFVVSISGGNHSVFLVLGRFVRWILFLGQVGILCSEHVDFFLKMFSFLFHWDVFWFRAFLFGNSVSFFL